MHHLGFDGGNIFSASCEFEFLLLKSARFSAIQVHSVRLKNKMINESKQHTHIHIYICII